MHRALFMIHDRVSVEHSNRILSDIASSGGIKIRFRSIGNRAGLVQSMPREETDVRALVQAG